MRDRYQKLLSNTGLIALGSFGSKLIVFFMVRFYTGCLTKEQFSTADLIMETAKLLMPLFCVGITDAVFRFALDEKRDRREVFSIGLYAVLGGGALLALLSPLASLAGVSASFVALTAAYVSCANLHSLVSYYIRTRDRFRLYALQGILNTLLVVCFNLLFLLGFGWKVEGYVLSVVLADLITFVVVFSVEKLWTECISPKRFRRETVRSMLRYSVPLIPTTIFWWITSVSDRYMLTAMVGSAENGIYTAANKIPTMISMLCTIFIQAWGFSSVREKNERERSAFFTTTFRVYTALLFTAGGGVILFCQILSLLLFDPSYFTAWHCIPLLTLAILFSSLVSFLGSVYTVRSRSGGAFLTAMCGAGVNLVLNLLLIPDRLFGLKMAGWGAEGAAVATVCSYFAVFLLRAFTARRYVRFRLGAFRLAVNGILVCAMAVGFCLFPKDWLFPSLSGFLIQFFTSDGLTLYLYEGALALLLVLFNLPPLLTGVKKLLSGGRRGTGGTPAGVPGRNSAPNGAAKGSAARISAAVPGRCPSRQGGREASPSPDTSPAGKGDGSGRKSPRREGDGRTGGSPARRKEE